MTPKERQLTAIHHELPDRIPVDAICIEPAGEIGEYLGIEVTEVAERLGIDGRIVAAGWQGALPADSAGGQLSQWGTPVGQPYGTTHAAPLAHADSVAVVERYPWPDAAHYDYAGVGQSARMWGERYAVRGPYWFTLFCQASDLFGMEELMVRMLVEPEIVEAALEAILTHHLDYCERFLDACGDALPIFYLGDDFASQRGLLISPEQWRRFLKPRYARLFELGKRRGKYVWFHSCGDITAVLPDLIDIGMDVWETVQLHTLPMPSEVLKREYGKRITFFGGVSTQRLPFAAPDEVREEVIHCISVLGKGGGYICGPDHHIKPDVPPANAVALFDAATAFRGEGYTAEI
ncbi:MAG: uroporphyrinogen decarboxylase family protein [Armatimonadota bacterium]